MTHPSHYSDNHNSWYECRINYKYNNKGDGPNVQSFINDIIKYTIKKVNDNYLNAHFGFRRMTFIQMDKCYVCDKEQVETHSCRIDNFMGSNLLMGWIYCKHCEAYV